MSVLFADGFQLPFPKATLGNRFGIHDVVNGHDLYGPQGHRGVDFRVGANALVTAVANAEVVKVLWSDVLGNVVVLRHYLHGDTGSPSTGDVYSFSCHLSNTIAKPGQQLKLNAPIGHSGATGSAAVGAHLHLAMSHSDTGGLSGEVFDPLAFIERNTRVPVPAGVKPITTTARKGEGLIRIAARSNISFTTIKKLNPSIASPDYVVQLGEQVRIR